MIDDFGPRRTLTYKVGVDLVEVSKVRKVFAGKRALLEKTFAPKEINYYARRRDRFVHLAEIFAVKEALFKALETGLSGEMDWLDVEIRGGSDGRASLKLRGKTAQVARQRGVIADFLSFSHSHQHAVALVVLIVDGKQQ